MKNATLRVGLTGGAGSGKTLAMTIWRELGVPVLCADEIARDATRPSGALIPTIRDAFGARFFDDSGALDRRALRAHILADGDAKARLEGIIHPHVRGAILAWLEQRSEPYCVVVIPLLVETNMQRMFDTTVTISCARETRIRRLMARDNCSRHEAELLLKNQADDEKRIQSTQEVIHNNDDVAHLREQIILLHKKMMSLFEGRCE